MPFSLDDAEGDAAKIASVDAVTFGRDTWTDTTSRSSTDEVSDSLIWRTSSSVVYKEVAFAYSMHERHI